MRIRPIYHRLRNRNPDDNDIAKIAGTYHNWRNPNEFGYPPDMQMLATETVLKQAEMIAEELTKNK